MNPTKIKLTEALTKAEDFIEQMEQFDDKRLQKHLDLFREQMNVAYKKNNADGVALLSEYERQVIEARVAKLDKSVLQKQNK